MAPGRLPSLMAAGPVFMTAGGRSAFLSDYCEPSRPRRGAGHLLGAWRSAADYNQDCPPELMHGEVVAMLRAWRGRAQAYSAVGHHDLDALTGTVRCPVLLLTSPDDFSHATFDRATAAFPSARTAMTGGGNF